MKSAFDEIITTAVRRQHEPQHVVGDLLTAEIAEKHARSINYQMTIAKLPLAKDIDDFVFDDTPINETLVRDLAGGNSGERAGESLAYFCGKKPGYATADPTGWKNWGMIEFPRC
jgi:hypothetical protein